MATAKKKASAKRTVKYAAKAQSSARQTSQPSAAKPASWVGTGSAEQWQKGAQDWAKQSAKLYQLPFAQGDVGAATQQAAEQVKSATENMVKMGSDMMNQMFAQGKQAKASAGSAASSFDPSSYFKHFQSAMPDMSSMFQMPQMPGMQNLFDVGSAQEKLSAFLPKDSSAQLQKASKGAQRAAAEAVDASREHIEVLTEVANVATTVSKEVAAEVIGFLNKQFAQNVELSKQVMTCRTLNDMFDLANRVSKTNLDAFFSQSVKLSEMLFQCATDISEPLNESVSSASERMTKAMAH